jgi:hypothetical protein
MEKLRKVEKSWREGSRGRVVVGGEVRERVVPKTLLDCAR